MMPFRCLGLQKNVLRPFQFSESFVRTKVPLTSDPGCLYVAPSPLHFFAFSPSSTSRRIKSVCDASQSFSMESSVCLPCDVPQKWFGLEPRQLCRRCSHSGRALGAFCPAPGSKALVAPPSFPLRLPLPARRCGRG